MELSVYKIDGTESGKKVTLDPGIFGIEPNDHAIYLDVKQYLANQRQGTHKTKEKWEVNYSTKKVIRQKGSGGARHGSIKANIYVGGGRVFGPRPRDYSFKLNKKLKQLARFSALSYKVKEQALTIVENFNLETPKTKEFIKIIDGLKVNARKVLFVLPENMSNIYLSSRNIENVKVITVNELSTYDVVNSTSLIFIDGVQDILQGQYGNN
ncbi:MAG: 50S ribosomal protein L4 [Bacteroidetes bacterium GWE2_39_28]|nr:MAG: 50S ribosomal protein L4 [Bacteroidetes bacterium GWE2_39_28]OFY13486.1 MAG: 50S ribosomal protein L4 [Bacteroidetes bacterium GWF2_39_10]OFZ09325.1 MAG: 50S ribosomal protein L4 [Bacteroidetes bacterium RIFOXYB2_FULL_39_7]OFZ11647.1 MAG: 50S ribosomal protein L4 [Bacteroidetes bacterium RIFOXYC2_FULL_39_11]HCT94815.1 50S ribosomal protein L4 [Rikenellaceae bacterium]